MLTISPVLSNMPAGMIAEQFQTRFTRQTRQTGAFLIKPGARVRMKEIAEESAKKIRSLAIIIIFLSFNLRKYPKPNWLLIFCGHRVIEFLVSD